MPYGWGAICDILDKLIPGRMERYADELNNLTVQYDRALKEGRDTDAATILKRMKILRRKLGVKD